MKKFLEVISILILIPVIIFTFLNGSVSLIEGKNIFDPYIDTKTPKNFNFKKLEFISLNQTENEVIAILGEPLSKDLNPYTHLKEYNYSGDGKLYEKARKQNKSEYDDFAWFQCVIIFNEQNKVIQINKGWTFD